MRYVETLTGQATRALLTDRLWPNQREALATVEGYLASKTQRQCLVRMPTGSGKTAVIAVLAQLLANHEKVLVIAPWEHLTSQLREQLAASFWQKSRMRDEFSFRSVRQCTPANASDQLTAVADGGVLVCTNSTLQELHIGFRETYAKLKAWTSLVLVDEGHREPAPKWALAVRQLRKPTVLFSATPYRNDSRLFEFDPAHTYTYTFQRAVRDHVIRDVEFTCAAWPRGRLEAVEFVSALREFRAKICRENRIPPIEAKVVIRCETQERVRQIARELEKQGEDVVAFHDAFPNGILGILRNRVPELENIDHVADTAIFWVHQWKLMEGLDDPRFRILALFDGYPNCRNLVQQVGRILRNTGHIAGQLG